MRMADEIDNSDDFGTGNTAVEVGEKAKLTTVIATLTDAVKAGELDKAMALAKKERMATLRKS